MQALLITYLLYDVDRILQDWKLKKEPVQSVNLVHVSDFNTILLYFEIHMFFEFPKLLARLVGRNTPTSLG